MLRKRKELSRKHPVVLDHDGAEPSPNAVAALNLLRLGYYFDQSALHDRLRLIFKSYARQLSKMPMTMPTLLRCVEMYKQGMNEIIIQSSDAQEVEQILRYIQAAYVPNVVLFQVSDAPSKLHEYNQQLKAFLADRSEGTKIYFCRNFQCQLPLTSFEQFKEKLQPFLFTN